MITLEPTKRGTFTTILHEESGVIRKQLRAVYKRRYECAQNLMKKRKKQLTPMIDNIITSDQVLSKEFNPEPCVYGGVELSKNEAETLNLPPKFAMYQKIN